VDDQRYLLLQLVYI